MLLSSVTLDSLISNETADAKRILHGEQNIFHLREDNPTQYSDNPTQCSDNPTQCSDNSL